MAHFTFVTSFTTLGTAARRKYFFCRYGVCWLHVELQGVLKHHISSTLKTATKSQIDDEDKFVNLVYRYVILSVGGFAQHLAEHPT